MHMADALISPAVGGTMWVATTATTVYCAKKVRDEMDEAKIPLMGVAGAFIFAAQMLNFTIPGTGSSGHLGGGLILAILLGPEAAFLVMASVLGVQALFFADGGLLALGANVFNLAFFPAFIAYPLVYRPLAGANPSARRVGLASVVAALVGLELGALGVVLQTTLSGVSELPFSAFSAVVLPVHLAIGLVEGAVTAGLILFVRRAQPEMLSSEGRRQGAARGKGGRLVVTGLAVAVLLATLALAGFASTNPDGLEWSIAKVTGGAELQSQGGVRGALAALQAKTAFLPGYAPRPREASDDASGSKHAGDASDTGVTGALGAASLLTAGGIAAIMLKRRRTGSRRLPDG